MEDRMTGCTKHVKSATATRNLEEPLGRDEWGKRRPHGGLNTRCSQNLTERRARIVDRMNGCTKNADEWGTRCPHGWLNLAERRAHMEDRMTG